MNEKFLSGPIKYGRDADQPTGKKKQISSWDLTSWFRVCYNDSAAKRQKGGEIMLMTTKIKSLIIRVDNDVRGVLTEHKHFVEQKYQKSFSFNDVLRDLFDLNESGTIEQGRSKKTKVPKTWQEKSGVLC